MIWRKIDFNGLVIDMLPNLFRHTVTIEFYKSCVKPLIQIYEETLYKMQHDSRVIYLEKMLNEHFAVPGYNPLAHNATKKVFISDAPRISRNYIYLPEENTPLYLGTVYLGSTPAVNYKFIVNIPADYDFSESKLRPKIDYYKLAGKKYIIQTY